VGLVANEGESEGESRQTGESQVTIEFGNETLWGLVRRRREVGGRESQDLWGARRNFGCVLHSKVRIELNL